jgi:hypothetical protein
MDKPDWAKILRYLYESDGVLTIQDEMDIPDRMESKRERQKMEKLQHKLIDECGLSADSTDSVDETLTHMCEINLIERTKKPIYGRIKLTSKGFDVVHERELADQNNRINFSLVFLTFILVLAQIVSVVPLDDWVKVLSGFILLVGMLIIVLRTDLLER